MDINVHTQYLKEELNQAMSESPEQFSKENMQEVEACFLDALKDLSGNKKVLKQMAKSISNTVLELNDLELDDDVDTIVWWFNDQHGYFRAYLYPSSVKDANNPGKYTDSDELPEPVFVSKIEVEHEPYMEVDEKVMGDYFDWIEEQYDFIDVECLKMDVCHSAASEKSFYDFRKALLDTIATTPINNPRISNTLTMYDGTNQTNMLTRIERG